MARVGRIAGSLLVESQGKYTLVGYPKEPCAWEHRGLAPPPPVENWTGASTPLEALGHVQFNEVLLEVSLEGEPLVVALLDRLVVTRNGSVSERLWRMIVDADDEGNIAPGVRDASWLTDMPASIWNLVRDTVLRCS